MSNSFVSLIRFRKSKQASLRTWTETDTFVPKPAQTLGDIGSSGVQALGPWPCIKQTGGTLTASLSITPAAVECSPYSACFLLLHFMLRASLLKLSLYLSISVGDRKDLSSCKRRRRHCWRVFIVSILLCEAKTISLVIASVNFLLERWEEMEGGTIRYRV